METMTIIAVAIVAVAAIASNISIFKYLRLKTFRKKLSAIGHLSFPPEERENKSIQTTNKSGESNWVHRSLFIIILSYI